MNTNIVTYAKVFLIKESDSDLRGYAEVKLYDSVILAGIKIIETQEGNIHIHYPKNHKSKRGMYYHFIPDPKVRTLFEDAIIDAYQTAIEEN